MSTAALTSTTPAPALPTTPGERVKLTPVQTAIALLIKEIHRDDEAAVRAVNNLLSKPDLPPLLAFDGVEARFQSESEPELENVVTAEGCSCRGGRHPWCVHRVRFRVLLVEAAALDPLGLLSCFLEQVPDSMRRPGPYRWPAPAPLRAATLPEAELPDFLLPDGSLRAQPAGDEPPPPDEADRRGSGRPRSRVAPVDPDVQREIDELYPL
ncbi:MAG: hypothetical protein HGA45_19100 [Chloroflexales bacterium]|nr:hypothetical protein [Chloroflexales bacterium]